MKNPKEIINKIVNTKFKLILIMIFVLFLMNKSVEATGGTATSVNSSIRNSASYLFEIIRAMETPTGTLGVNSNINTTNYVDIPVNGKTNGIDCHMSKNTEWGTLTILSASDYGNKTSTNTVSTANNGTGVFGLTYCPDYSQEYTTALFKDANNNNIQAIVNADGRYKNIYESGTTFVGDGYDMNLAQETSEIYVSDISSSYPIGLRGINSVFSHQGSDGYSRTSIIYTNWKSSARAVITQGVGL